MQGKRQFFSFNVCLKPLIVEIDRECYVWGYHICFIRHATGILLGSSRGYHHAEPETSLQITDISQPRPSVRNICYMLLRFYQIMPSLGDSCQKIMIHFIKQSTVMQSLN